MAEFAVKVTVRFATVANTPPPQHWHTGCQRPPQKHELRNASTLNTSR